jgi:predicted DNA repair protein MutK
MSGLLAVLDDVAAIAKVAAASVDDVMAQAVKASSKAAGAVIDDAAVTPKFLTGFSAKRELPIVWRIARGSLFNKLVILLPVALLLSQFAAWAIPILLMIGGAYLCYEGAEKVAHWWHKDHAADDALIAQKQADPHLEESKVKGAIKTDFILSAEIMTIVLAALPQANIWLTAGSLAVAGIMITVFVYGAVAIIVKADDVGLHMAQNGRLNATRKLGEGIVKAMPSVLTTLTVVGTVAMLWVGGAIIVHGLEELGYGQLGHAIKDLAKAGQAAISPEGGTIAWAVQAVLDAIVGLLIGLVLIPLSNAIFIPLAKKVGLA